MNGPGTEGGLTTGREFALLALIMASVIPFAYISGVLFPDLPLHWPYLGAMMALVGIPARFMRLHRPPGWPRTIKYFVAVGMMAGAGALTVAAILAATGWAENESLEIVASFAGAGLIVLPASWGLFKVMIQRHDGPLDEEERPA